MDARFPWTSLGPTRMYRLTAGFHYSKRFIEPLDAEPSELSVNPEKSPQATLLTAAASQSLNITLAEPGNGKMACLSQLCRLVFNDGVNLRGQEKTAGCIE